MEYAKTVPVNFTSDEIELTLLMLAHFGNTRLDDMAKFRTRIGQKMLDAKAEIEGSEDAL